MPKQHLTDRFLKNAAAPGKRVEYFDQHKISNGRITAKGVKGLLIRVTKAGNVKFYYAYRINENVKRYKIGDYPNLSLSEARQKARQLSQQVKKGIDPAAQKSKLKAERPKTLAEVATEYQQKHVAKLKESTQTDYNRRIDVILRNLDKRRHIKDLKRYEILDFLDSIAQTAPTQAQRIQAILSGMFKFALDREYVDGNIATNISFKAPKKKANQNVAFDDYQLKTLWNGFSEYGLVFGSLFKMLLLTGQRCGETRQMKWEHINMKARLWEIPAANTKNGTRHQVYLSNMAIELLEQLQATNGEHEHVFNSPVKPGQPIGYPGKQAQRIRERHNVPNFNVHSLRTTFATRLAGLSVQPQVLSKILNHKKPGAGSTITAAYNKHEYKSERKAAMENWSRELNRILTGQPAKVTKIG